MLREHEQDFTLWIPSGLDCDFAVYDDHGPVRAITTPGPGTSQVSLQAAP